MPHCTSPMFMLHKLEFGAAASGFKGHWVAWRPHMSSLMPWCLGTQGNARRTHTHTHTCINLTHQISGIPNSHRYSSLGCSFPSHEKLVLLNYMLFHHQPVSRLAPSHLSPFRKISITFSWIFCFLKKLPPTTYLCHQCGLHHVFVLEDECAHKSHQHTLSREVRWA